MAYDESYSNPYEGGSSLVFNGVDLGKECDMFVLGKGVFGAPSRDVTQIHVPGRNGDILIDNGGWNNVDVTYSSCCILSNFRENAAKLRGYLLANPGYHELTDPYNPDEVRYAEFRGPFTPEAFTSKGNNAGMFDLTFNCKPQRFLRESTIARDYVLCPYTIEQNYTTDYSIDVKVKNAGSTLKFTFIPHVTDLVTRYVNFYKSDGTTVSEDIDVYANDGVVEIPLIGKDGTKYYGVKCYFVFHVRKSENLRMESSNSVVEGKTTYFYYKDDVRDIFFPFYNPTQFDAYILMSGCYIPAGTYGQHFHFVGDGHSISVSDSLGYTTTSEVGFDFNGLEDTACTWDNKSSKIKKVYAGLSGTLLVIPGGGRHELEVNGVSSFKNVQITPMYYRI